VVSLAGVAPSWMVSVSASVNLSLHHKVQKFSSGTGSPGWSQEKGRKMVVVVMVVYQCSKHDSIVYMTRLLFISFEVVVVFCMCHLLCLIVLLFCMRAHRAMHKPWVRGLVA